MIHHLALIHKHY